MLKKYLLSLKCFIDNNYLDEYLDFCFNYTTTEAYTEAHHIIPVSYYKQYKWTRPMTFRKYATS